MTDQEPRQPADLRLFAIRLAIGLAQGLAVFAIEHGKRDIPTLALGPLWTVALLLPVVALGAVGRLRPRLLALWLGAALGLTAGLGLYRAWAVTDTPMPDVLVPPFALIAFLGAALFILHHLITAAAAEGRWRANYARYFDDGWLDALRLVVSVAFVCALFLLLRLGAELFHLIGIDALRRLIARPWFIFPVAGAFFAIAIHITDIRIQLVRGARTLALTLLSWLLPVLAGFVAAFLLTLPFTGLAPLWATRSATGILLAVCAALVILINATYQDGERQDFPPFVLRWAARLAAALLAPMVVIAVYGLSLRIGQYGLTPERLYAAAALVVAAVYAAGYLWAAVIRGPWLRRLESTNWLAAHVAVAVVILIFSPLLDPARLSVADQMRRLETGRTTAADFDYRFLHFEAGRWGRAALERLAAGPDPVIAKAARAEQAMKDRWRTRATPGDPAPVIEAPAGPLPPSFLTQDWSGDLEGPATTCLRRERCVGLTGDIDGQPGDEVILYGGLGNRVVYGQRGGRWVRLGLLAGRDCSTDLQALRDGKFRFAPAAPAPTFILDGRVQVYLPESECPATSAGVKPRP